MASPSAVRYVAATTKSALDSIHLQCHIKPGASKKRQGIIFVSEDLIEVCVTAQAREGEANKAVKELMSRVSDLLSFAFDYLRDCQNKPLFSTISNLLVLGTQMSKV
jgi:hypothetical protein